MKRFKYVIANDIPILFFMGIDHKDVARGSKIKSAGFCRIWYSEDNQRWSCKCFGESVSLNIQSRPEEDSKLLTTVLNSDHY